MIGEFQPFLNISFRLSERSAVGCKFFGCHLAYKTNNFAKVNKKMQLFQKNQEEGESASAEEEIDIKKEEVTLRCVTSSW